MKQTLIVGFFPMFLACSGSSDEPFECSFESRNGSYLLESEEISGDCGEAPSSVVIVDTESTELEPGCTLEYSRFSDDECRNETKATCIDNGLTIEATGVVTQRSTDFMDGTLTINIDGVCFSTYNVTYTRQ